MKYCLTLLFAVFGAVVVNSLPSLETVPTADEIFNAGTILLDARQQQLSDEKKGREIALLKNLQKDLPELAKQYKEHEDRKGISAKFDNLIEKSGLKNANLELVKNVWSRLDAALTSENFSLVLKRLVPAFKKVLDPWSEVV